MSNGNESGATECMRRGHYLEKVLCRLISTLRLKIINIDFDMANFGGLNVVNTFFSILGVFFLNRFVFLEIIV